MSYTIDGHTITISKNINIYFEIDNTYRIKMSAEHCNFDNTYIFFVSCLENTDNCFVKINGDNINFYVDSGDTIIVHSFNYTNTEHLQLTSRILSSN